MASYSTTQTAGVVYVLGPADVIGVNDLVGLAVPAAFSTVQIAGSIFAGTAFGIDAAVKVSGLNCALLIAPSAHIAGTDAGLWFTGSAGVVINAGAIAARSSAVWLDSFQNYLTNTGTISGQIEGVRLSGRASIINSGEITGMDIAAIVCSSNGTINLVNSGAVLGGSITSAAILLSDSTFSDVIVNKGTIVGQVRMGGGDDRFDGSTGTTQGDVLLGTGADTGIGGAGADRLFGDAGSDVLQGNEGNDTLDGGADVDVLTGGAGDDTYVIDSRADEITEFAGFGRDTVVVTFSYVLEEFFENVSASTSAAVALTGNAERNVLRGGGGADTLNGAAGIDTMIGGAGADTYIVDSAFERTIEKAGNGSFNDTIVASVSWTLAEFTETLVLIGSAVTGVGNVAVNTITGTAGNNVLQGLGSNDTLSGGAGNDLLSGGLGVDQLTGGAGLDAFLFDVAPAAGNADVITDFVAVDDTIRLENAVFTGLPVAGFLAAAAFRSGANVTTAGDASDRIAYDTATGRIFYGADGAGGAASVLVATLTTKPPLTAADFLVV